MDKRTKFEKDSKEQDKDSESTDRVGVASRARNRTVMLTPDVAGNIRARLMETDNASVNKDFGFISPLNRGGSGSENLRDSTRMIKRDDLAFKEESPKEKAEEKPTSKFSTMDYQKERVAQVVQEKEEDFVETKDFPVERTQERVFEAPRQQVEPPRESRAEEFPTVKQVAKTEKKKLIGFFVSFQEDQNGEIVELRVGRWLITSRPSDQGECIVIDHETVSPLHAILRVSDKGAIQVLDQLSEFGTSVTREGSEEEEEIAGSMASISHGDKVRFGERTYVVCLVPISK